MPLNISNLDKLIAHLEAQPPERINMAWGAMTVTKHYGECGCIIAHIGEVSGERDTNWLAKDTDLWPLFGPEDWVREDDGEPQRYPAHRVIATLKRLRDHYRATGEIVVDWGPEPTAGEPWAASQAPELTPPALPAEITRLLSAPSDTSESAGLAVREV